MLNEFGLVPRPTILYSNNSSYSIECSYSYKLHSVRHWTIMLQCVVCCNHQPRQYFSTSKIKVALFYHAHILSQNIEIISLNEHIYTNISKACNRFHINKHKSSTLFIYCKLLQTQPFYSSTKLFMCWSLCNCWYCCPWIAFVDESKLRQQNLFFVTIVWIEVYEMSTVLRVFESQCNFILWFYKACNPGC